MRSTPTFLITSLIIICNTFSVFSQPAPLKITDSNTALHLLPPDYQVPYGPAKTEEILAVLNRIFGHIDTSTPARVIDRQTKTEITDMTKLTSGSIFEPGVFRLISYEWGVAYGAMLLASEATGDPKFGEYLETSATTIYSPRNK